jgi:peroxiredoxin
VWGLVVVAVFVAAAAVLLGFSRSSSSSAGGEQVVNGPAPDFTLPAAGGGNVSLSDYRGEKNVLLFFNEGYGCAPCWQQIRGLQDRREEFDKAETELAVMVDPLDVLWDGGQSYGIAVPMLSDTERAVSNAYKVLGRGMHASKPNHTFVLIDKQGEIVWWKDYVEMRAPIDDVVAKVQDLVGSG